MWSYGCFHVDVVFWLFSHCCGLTVVFTLMWPYSCFHTVLQFPAVKKPKTLEKHYQGTLTSLLIDFMSVSNALTLK